MLGYSQRATVADEVKAAQGAQAGLRDQLAAASLDWIRREPDLLRFAMAGGAAAFQVNCAPCHGRGGQGFVGYPNLNDDDWIWGGTIEDIHKTISNGVRSDQQGRARLADAALRPRQAAGGPADRRCVPSTCCRSLARRAIAAAVARGAKVFADQCASCHGPDGKGNQDQGAPNLTDDIWLYGGSRQAIVESIRTGRGGMMPAWVGRLDPVTLKSLAVYVHSLGGGK